MGRCSGERNKDRARKGSYCRYTDAARYQCRKTASGRARARLPVERSNCSGRPSRREQGDECGSIGRCSRIDDTRAITAGPLAPLELGLLRLVPANARAKTSDDAAAFESVPAIR